MERKNQSGESLSELARLRDEIDQIDGQLIEIIARRTEIARRARDVKLASGMPAVDPSREVAVIWRALDRAQKAGVSGAGVRQIMWHLIGISRRAQHLKTNGQMGPESREVPRWNLESSI